MKEHHAEKIIAVIEYLYASKATYFVIGAIIGALLF